MSVPRNAGAVHGGDKAGTRFYQTPGQHSTPVVHADSLDDLKRAPNLWVGTPDDILARCAADHTIAALNFNPLAGGLPPAMAWESLELFAAEVLPKLR